MARVLAALDERTTAGARAVICIDGPSGSGKSSLAGAVVDALAATGTDAAAVHTDHLLDGWSGLPTLPQALVAQVLRPFTAGRGVQHRCYDWTQGHFGAPVAIGTPSALVVEGVGSGAREVSAVTDLLVWVDAAPTVRQQRTQLRDPEVDGWWDDWAEAERVHHALQGTSARADLTVLT